MILVVFFKQNQIEMSAAAAAVVVAAADNDVNQ